MTDGPRTTTTITITDGPAFAATITFDSATYSVAEDDTVNVGLTLSAAPGTGQTVTIPITAAIQGTTAAGDYSVATSVKFGATETTKTVIFSATDDTDEDHGDSVQLGFGATLPTGVTSTAPITTTVVIIDDDPPVTVSFGTTTAYHVVEGDSGGSSVTVAVALRADVKRPLTVPITATGAA